MSSPRLFFSLLYCQVPGLLLVLLILHGTFSFWGEILADVIWVLPPLIVYWPLGTSVKLPPYSPHRSQWQHLLCWSWVFTSLLSHKLGFKLSSVFCLQVLIKGVCVYSLCCNVGFLERNVRKVWETAIILGELRNPDSVNCFYFFLQPGISSNAAAFLASHGGF